MKKILPLIWLLLFPTLSLAAYDPSKIIEAWELDSSIVGAQNLYNLTWTGTPSYNTTIFYSGTASAGPFPATQYLTSPTITQACYGVAFWIYIATGHLTSETDMIHSDNNWSNWKIFVYNNGISFYSYDHWIGPSTPASLSLNQWHYIEASVAGAGANLYVDTALIGSDVLGYGAGETGISHTFMGAAASTGVYIDRLQLLATPGNGSYITPIIIGTPTFTPTITQTYTITPTPPYTSDVVVALQMENNVYNSGSGNYTFTWIGTPTYSNTIVKDGNYSAGIINQQSQYIINNQGINSVIKTIQSYFYVPRLKMPIQGTLWCDNNGKSELYMYYGQIYYYDATNGTFGPYDISQNSFHTVISNFDGTNINLVIDGISVLTHKAYQPGTDATDLFYIGSDNTSTLPIGGYIDDFLMSTNNSNGTPIIELNSTATPTPNLTLTSQANMTNTQIVILSYTPTPQYTVSICGNPFPAVFTQNPTPVLVPIATYEANCVVEPNVIYCNVDNKYHMTYSANAFELGGLLESICIATASNPEGPWTRYQGNPVIGGNSTNGALGINASCRMSFQLHIGSEYRIYFRNDNNDNVDYATSTDGLNYTYVGTALDRCEIPANICQYCAPLDGIGIIYDGSSYWAIAEIQSDESECAGKVAYFLWLYKSTDNAQTFHSATSNELLSLSPNPGGTLYAGGRATVLVNGHWHTWTHVGYQPTDIYHSESYDKYNWKTDSTQVVIPTTTMFGLLACDQAADTSIIEANNNLYLFYDGTDNYYSAGRIGYSKYNGTLTQYDQCYIPHITPTPFEKIYFNGEFIFSKTPEIIFNNSNKLF